MRRRIGAALLVVVGLVACGVHAQDEAAPAAAAVGGEVTEHGRQFQGLMEAHLKEVHGDRLEQENAWPALESAIEMMREVSPNEARIDFALVYGPEEVAERHDPTGEKLARAMAALEVLEERGFFEAIEEVAARKNIVTPAQPGPIFEWDFFEHRGLLRSAARALAARMHLEAEAENFDEAVVSFESILAVGRFANRSPMLIGHLTGTAVVAYACSRARVDLLGRDLEPDHLHAMLAAIERQQPVGSLSLAFKGERLMALETIEYVYDPEKRLEHFVMEDVQRNKGDEELWEAERAFVERHGQWLIETTRLPPWQMLSVLEEAEARIPLDLPVASMLVPASHSAAQLHAHVLAQLEGTRLMIALELMQRDAGEYPESLEALAPDYIAELPVDPYTGESFLYRRFETGEDPRGRGYLLYSTGLDGVDNGGRLHERGAAYATGRSGAGFDLVINEPLEGQSDR